MHVLEIDLMPVRCRCRCYKKSTAQCLMSWLTHAEAGGVWSPGKWCRETPHTGGVGDAVCGAVWLLPSEEMRWEVQQVQCYTGPEKVGARVQFPLLVYGYPGLAWNRQ